MVFLLDKTKRNRAQCLYFLYIKTRKLQKNCLEKNKMNEKKKKTWRSHFRTLGHILKITAVLIFQLELFFLNSGSTIYFIEKHRVFDTTPRLFFVQLV
jgi:hypothetical protein